MACRAAFVSPCLMGSALIRWRYLNEEPSKSLTMEKRSSASIVI